MTHTATAERKSKITWVVSCTCGVSYKVSHQAQFSSVEEHARFCAANHNAKHAEDLYRAVESADGRWDVQGWNGTAYENIAIGLDKTRAFELAADMIDSEAKARRLGRYERHAD